jgi:DinB superfamily
MDYSVESAREVLRRTPDALRAMLADLPDEWLHGRESDEAWSPYQVCGHLLHIEECDWIDRTRVILEHGTSRVFEPVDREAGFARFRGWPLIDLLDTFAATRRANLEELATLLGPGALDRRGIHPSFGEVTLAQLLATWVVHDLNHLNQIVKTMAKQYADAVGPWRAFLPVLDAP